MLIIEYHATNGISVPDGNALEVVQQAAAISKSQAIDYTLVVGNELLVNMARLLVAREVLKPTEIVFKYKDEMITVDRAGRLNKWPEGFCDYSDNILMEIV